MAIRRTLKQFVKDESGQGITEYAAILAFVSALAIMVFGFSNGTLEGSLSQTFSGLVGQFDRLNSATVSHDQ